MLTRFGEVTTLIVPMGVGDITFNQLAKQESPKSRVWLATAVVLHPHGATNVPTLDR